MANIRNFSGDIELTRVSAIPNAQFAARFPGVRGIRYDGYQKRVGWAEGRTLDSQMLPLERCITYKSNPSKHECNGKCMGGNPNGTCECQCGGRNHGRGSFTRLLVAEVA